MKQQDNDDLWRDFPKTATEFEAQFATEEDCRAYWIQAHWGGTPACARCKSTREDGRIERKEGKAHSTAREFILEAEKHPVVKAYVKAIKFIEDENARTQDGLPVCPVFLLAQKLCPNLCVSTMCHTCHLS